MKQNRRIIHYSILAALAGAIALPATAAVKINNTSRPNRASMYQQVNAASLYAPTPQSAHVDEVATALAGEVVTGSTDASDIDLPVRVANAALAAKIANGDPNVAGIDRLQACANIYPNGEFEWATPSIGIGAGGGATCVSVVELRGYQMGEDGSDVVLARGRLAAGDSFRCNISDFHESDYMPAAGEIVFPADQEPTTEDVIAVMNQEQKQNAGLKIAASVLVGGVGGNIAGKNEVGQDSLMGGGKDKIKGTIIGALGAGAVTTAATFSGKVAGDTIMSAGINAAAGSVVGNIMSTGDSVLRIEDCELPDGTNSSCLWGMLITNTPLDTTKEIAYVNISDDNNTTYVCDVTTNKCKAKELIAITIDVDTPTGRQTKSLADLKKNDFEAIQANGCRDCYYYDRQTEEIHSGTTSDGSGILARVASAGYPGRQVSALVSGVNDKAFGMKRADWDKIRVAHADDEAYWETHLYSRGTNGNAYALSEKYNINDFYPMLVDASDGGIIDMGNKARLKATLTGAGVGGALGAYSGYQGAQDEVSARWVSAVREYKDSLQKVVCMTGGRFLGFYNDTVAIPAPLSE